MGKKNPFIGSTLEEAEREFREKDPAFGARLDELQALREGRQPQQDPSPPRSTGGLRKPSSKPN